VLTVNISRFGYKQINVEIWKAGGMILTGQNGNTRREL
jgi:hypothetical protein